MFNPISRSRRSTRATLTCPDEERGFHHDRFPGLRISTLKRSSTTGEFRIPSLREEEKYGVIDVQVPIVFMQNTYDDYIGLLEI
jgi:hypothetical protein